MSALTRYDIAFLGNDTKDTIVSAAGTHYVDSGAFSYWAQAGARKGLRVAAITRLPRARQGPPSRLQP